MSDHLFSQFPRQPELQPLASPPTKGQQILSLILIVIGLTLLGVGGWMFYQYQLEAGKPPPARIVEVSLANLTQTPTLQPSPTSTPSLQRVDDIASHSVGDTISRTTIHTATPHGIRNTIVSPTSGPEITPTLTSPLLGPKISETVDSLSEVPPTPKATTTSEPAVEAAPSLEDNPLVLPEDNTSASRPVGDTGPETNKVSTVVPTSGEASPITRIVAESIGLDAPVITVGWDTITREDGTSVNVWIVADYAVGWHKNSALPGQGGNIVLSGHHNIKGEVFRRTIELNVGDIVTLYEGDQTFKYVVVDKFIVKDKGEPEAIRRENAKWIGPFNEERLTLVTCWPYTNNTHRAIVIAKPTQ